MMFETPEDDVRRRMRETITEKLKQLGAGPEVIARAMKRLDELEQEGDDHDRR